MTNLDIYTVKMSQKSCDNVFYLFNFFTYFLDIESQKWAVIRAE